MIRKTLGIVPGITWVVCLTIVSVTANDKVPPQIVYSVPKDGEKGVDPVEINTNGMEIHFSEPLAKLIVDVSVEGKSLQWISKLADGNKTARIVMLKGRELPYESEVVVRIILHVARNCAFSKV